jgi:hypothetical protein
MTQSSPEQRAEAARLLALRDGDIWWPSYEEWGDLLLSLLPALLADAEALAAIEAQGERTRAALTRLARLSEEAGLYDQEAVTDGD